MAVGDVYSVKLFGNLQGTDNLNVFNYIVTGGGGGVDNAQDLGDIFNTGIQGVIAAIASITQSYDRIEVFQWSDPSNFATIPAGSMDEPIGLRPGDGMSNFVAWSYTLVRVAPGQRSGGKRIAGVAEPDLNGYVPVAGILTPLANVATAMGSVLAGVLGNYSAFVAKRPLTLGINPTGYIPSAVSFAGVGSQVSRKRSLDSQ